MPQFAQLWTVVEIFMSKQSPCSKLHHGSMLPREVELLPELTSLPGGEVKALSCPTDTIRRSVKTDIFFMACAPRWSEKRED